MLRIVFRRLGKPNIGSPQAFSFNTATISGPAPSGSRKGGKKVREKPRRARHSSEGERVFEPCG